MGPGVIDLLRDSILEASPGRATLMSIVMTASN